jgi:osomolarity two-component system, response regulator SSK1
MGMLDTAVPPINVLIVEDNIINLKLLEAFMKRLKVRWKTAMNGKEAVAVWRTGGFHLVLMDIQLPVMNGLEATKEIRRLESLNKIGVLSGSTLDGLRKLDLNGSDIDGDLPDEEMKSEDRLQDREAMFKSPVIIVALTASSLQSDRHEALAAGCNDFLTKVCTALFPPPYPFSTSQSNQP